MRTRRTARRAWTAAALAALACSGCTQPPAPQPPAPDRTQLEVAERSEVEREIARLAASIRLLELAGPGGLQAEVVWDEDALTVRGRLPGARRQALESGVGTQIALDDVRWAESPEPRATPQVLVREWEDRKTSLSVAQQLLNAYGAQGFGVKAEALGDVVILTGRRPFGSPLAATIETSDRVRVMDLTQALPDAGAAVGEEQ